jgi:integrase
LWEDPHPIALPKFRLYDFRHTNLTRFYDATLDIVLLKDHAGWSSVRMADRYVHANDRKKAQAARRFDAYIEDEQKRIASD